MAISYQLSHILPQLSHNPAPLVRRKLRAALHLFYQTLTAPSKKKKRISKNPKVCMCKKTVYPLEKVTWEGEFYHKSCFRCAHGGCFLTPSSYAALDGILYCKPHFAQLFKEKESYSHLTKTTLISSRLYL